MQGPTPQSRAYFTRLQCLLSLPLECVACGGGWVVVLQRGLWLFTGCQVLGPPRRCRPKSVTVSVLFRATWHMLQSNLQLAGTCAGLGDG